MTKLDVAIQRLRALSEAEQDAIAAQIELMLDAGIEEELTPAQWAEIEARLDTEEGFTSHADVARAFADRFG